MAYSYLQATALLVLALAFLMSLLAATSPNWMHVKGFENEEIAPNVSMSLDWSFWYACWAPTMDLFADFSPQQRTLILFALFGAFPEHEFFRYKIYVLAFGAFGSGFVHLLTVIIWASVIGRANQKVVDAHVISTDGSPDVAWAFGLTILCTLMMFATGVILIISEITSEKQDSASTQMQAPQQPSFFQRIWSSSSAPPAGPAVAK